MNQITKENIQIVEAALLNRHSVRHFNSNKIPHQDLLRLVKAGIHAPSGSNWQNQRFLLVEDDEELMRIGKHRFVWPYKGANHQRIKKNYPAGIIGNSAAAIIVFSNSLDNDRRGNGEYYLWEGLESQNCSASIENILTLATAMGIGSCWVSASDKMNYTRMFSGQSWRKIFANYQIPSYYKLQGIVILGYPRSTDEEGYPIGEKKHGATIWQETERKPTENYLIQKLNDYNFSNHHLSKADQLSVRVLLKIIKFGLKAITWCDKKIHSIEITKYLKP